VIIPYITFVNIATAPSHFIFSKHTVAFHNLFKHCLKFKLTGFFVKISVPQLFFADISNLSQDVAIDKKKCYNNQAVWREVLSNRVNVSPTPQLNSRVMPCVSDAFHWIVNNQSVSNDGDKFRDVISLVDHVQIFVTGSLYLVGMVLKLLEDDKLINDTRTMSHSPQS
jgi:hypothetical protein